MKYKKNDFICLLFWTNKQTFCNFFSDQLAARWPSDKFLQQGVFLGCWSEFIWKNGFGLKAFFFCFWVNLGPILGEKWLYGQVANIFWAKNGFMGKLPTYFWAKNGIYGQVATYFWAKNGIWASCPKKYRLRSTRSNQESDETELTCLWSFHLHKIHLAESHFVVLEAQRVINTTDSGVSKGGLKTNFPFLFLSPVDESF